MFIEAIPDMDKYYNLIVENSHLEQSKLDV
jgi:hypothetical protein